MPFFSSSFNEPSPETPFLTRLRRANVERCRTGFKKELTDWSEMQWGCAIAGEVGELCNNVKKRERDGEQAVSTEECAKEIADTICYLDLLAARMGIDIEEAVTQKFNEVSDRVNSTIKL